MNIFTFDLVLPCYNPSASWREIALKNFNALKEIYGDQFVNLIIVNDGSHTTPDPAFLKTSVSGFVWIDYSSNQGKGFALRQGVARSNSHFCFYTDLDFPFGIEPLRQTYQKLACGADIVMGSRTKEYYKRLSVKRWAISNITNVLNRLLLRVPYNDTQAGLKGFNKKGKELFLKTTVNSFLFDTEFILMAARNKLKISTVHLTPRADIHFSSMKSKVLLKELKNFYSLMKK